MSSRTLQSLFAFLLAVTISLHPRCADAQWYGCGYGYTSFYSTTAWQSAYYYPCCHTHCCHYWPHCCCDHHHCCHHVPPQHCWYHVAYSFIGSDRAGQIHRLRKDFTNPIAIDSPLSANCDASEELFRKYFPEAVSHLNVFYVECNYYDYCQKRSHSIGHVTPYGKQKFGDKLDFLAEPGASRSKDVARQVELVVVSTSKSRQSASTSQRNGGRSPLALVRQPLDSAETWSMPVVHRGRLAGMTFESASKQGFRLVRQPPRFGLTIQPTASIPIAATVRKYPVRVILREEKSRNPVVAQRPEIKQPGELIGVASTLSSFYRFAGEMLHASLVPQTQARSMSVETVSTTQ